MENSSASSEVPLFYRNAPGYQRSSPYRRANSFRSWRSRSRSFKTRGTSRPFTTTEGNFIDHNAIEADIRALCDAHDVEKIRIEHHGSAQISANLIGAGLPVKLVRKKPDSYSNPSKLLEAWIEINKFRFDGNPVLTWMASNCVVDRRVNGSILPKKEHENSPKKIDSIDALIMAISGMTGERRRRSCGGHQVCLEGIEEQIGGDDPSRS
jgi:phage terminase large subunit-like protein